MGSKKRSSATSGDDLFEDADFCRMHEKQLERIRQGELESKRIFAAVVRRLNDAGFNGASLKDIVDRFAPLPSVAVEILLSSLASFRDEGAIEMIVRQLAASAAPFDGRPLVGCFEGTTDESLRWATLNTIACAMPHSIQAWIRNARRDTWVEETLLDIGRGAHGRAFDVYLNTQTDADDLYVESDQSASRYELVYGPVLRKLGDAGFDAHSIEELRKRFVPLPSAAVQILLASLRGLDDGPKRLPLQALQRAAEPFDGTELVACYDASSDEVLRGNILRTIAVTRPHSIDEWINALDPATKKLLRALDF